MSRKPKVLAVIPARGGSKGLPGKNIRPLCGKPLIAYTIEAALSSKLVDRAIVSTENDEIARVSREYGAEVLLRPKELAGDKSPIFDVFMHTINWLADEKPYDIVVLLEPTSPLRKDDDIDNALNFFIENVDRADSLVSLGEVQLENPYIMKKIENGLVTPLIELGTSFYQRQQLPKAYFPYGVIYLSKLSSLIEQKSFYQKRTLPFFIERWQNYEIDDIYDFECVEAILAQRLKNEGN